MMQEKLSSSPPMSRFLGAILLIAGCCIGAGMLGLPALTAAGGFWPTLFIFFLAWVLMATTGLLLLEVTLWFQKEKEEAHHKNHASINIVTMTSHTLGIWGKVLGWILFLFLFYSLMIAYIVAYGQLIADGWNDFFSSSLFQIPEWVGALTLTLILGSVLYLGAGAVDRLNRLLMVGLIFSYFALVVIGIPHINLTFLQHGNWKLALGAVPIMIISFGYHNLVPSLSSYLYYDVKKLRLAILIGSAIPLFIYLLWEALILGLVPMEGELGLQRAVEQGDMATRVLRHVAGISWVKETADVFAFFAIITSFLGVALSFVDFLSDGFHIPQNRSGKLLLCLLVLVPPFFFALLYPHLFLISLSYAGAYGAMMLFGILPVLMVYSGRYVKGKKGPICVPGGKIVLALVFLASVFVIAIQMLGV